MIPTIPPLSRANRTSSTSISAGSGVLASGLPGNLPPTARLTRIWNGRSNGTGHDVRSASPVGAMPPVASLRAELHQRFAVP